MPDRVILDSSVIAAIFFKEESSARAERAAENYQLITVNLAFAEVANVAWKRVALFNESKKISVSSSEDLKAHLLSLSFLANRI